MSATIWVIINFVVMIFVVYFILKFLFLRDKKLSDVFRQRKQAIEDNIKSSEQAIESAKILLKESVGNVSESLEEVNKIMNFTKQKQGLLEQKIRKDVERRREQLLKEVEDEVTRIINKATNEALVRFSEKVIDVVKTKIEEKSAIERQRQIIEAGLEKL